MRSDLKTKKSAADLVILQRSFWFSELLGVEHIIAG